jgi:hypothetical protein
MFEQGICPTQVAISLNLREKEVSELHREYWTLSGRYQLVQVYDELGDGIWFIIELYRRLKTEDITVEQVKHVIRTGTKLEHKIADL